MRRRAAVVHVRCALGHDRVSQRRACQVLGQPRSTQRRQLQLRSDEPRLVRRIVELASAYGRYGYRRITALLRGEQWRVNHKRVERLWRQEGLKVPARQPKRRRLWLGDGSCVRLRPAHRDHVWSYDFVLARTHDGRPVRMLTVIDEYTRECLAIDVARRLTSEDVLERLTDLFVRRGVPDYLRSDNGSEFTAAAVRDWLARVGVKTLYIEPGSPWENGYVESFNGKLRDELLDREIFDTLLEAKVLIERWRQEYNTVRPHSSLGYRPPAPEARQPWSVASATLQQLTRAAISAADTLT
jgi:transposase InsO family protein